MGDRLVDGEEEGGKIGKRELSEESKIEVVSKKTRKIRFGFSQCLRFDRRDRVRNNILK